MICLFLVDLWSKGLSLTVLGQLLGDSALWNEEARSVLCNEDRFEKVCRSDHIYEIGLNCKFLRWLQCVWKENEKRTGTPIPYVLYKAMS